MRLVSAAFVVCAAVFGVPSETDAQTVPASARAGEREGRLKLTPEEEQLVRDSRAAIVGTGFSENYFDKHFEPTQVYNSPGDRRVVWRFRLNGYETTVSDSVGFYTDNRGRRVDSHMVSASLGKTRDIRRTIPFVRAQSALRRCVGGEHGPGSVLLQRFASDGRVSLVFTAVALPPAGATRPTPAPGGPRPDGPKPPGGKKKPFLDIGTIDLETGRCLKGVAQAGSPQANQPQPQPFKPNPE